MIAAFLLTAALSQPSTANPQYQGILAAASYEHQEHVKHDEHLAYENNLKTQHIAYENKLRVQHIAYENNLHTQHIAYENSLRAQESVQSAPQTPRVASIQPSPAPAPRATPPVSSASGGGYLARVAEAESTDNPDAVNGDHWGLYQMTENLWVLGGGNPADYGSASAGEQTQVAQRVVTDDINGGTQNWQPYDHVAP